MSPTSLNESGIAVLDRNLNLMRTDKIFQIKDIEIYIKNLAPADSMIICVDLPRNSNMVNGKWRMEARYTKTFKLNTIDNASFDWADKFSDRGSDLCDTLNSLDIDTFRYYCYFTKNMLNLNPPYKSRSPVACKYLQSIIQNNLRISGISSNLLPLVGLDAVIGSYISWKMWMSRENAGYKYIGKHKQIPIVTAL
ncbi:MAG: hypothetical protein PHC34_00730 [Candidatus Gastranaerophilales bacterium]|nr:hypothetical protein [Candidatus Gastranaerophilales bacterium]